MDVNEFASYLIDLIKKGHQGHLDDFCGPEILSLKEMAELKIKIKKESNTALTIPFSGKLYNALIEGKNTNPMQKQGLITYEEYLRNKLS